MDEKNEKLDNNENVNKQKKEVKIKIWVLLVIMFIILVLGMLVGAIITEDKCDNNEKKSIIRPSSPAIDKPIIYLYPEEEIQISVKLGKPDNVTCSYPKYNNGWNVIAKPDGTLIDLDTGRSLYALYWEGISTRKAEIKEGFVVKKEDTIKFLEDKLEILGLNEREAEEFIVYWLPKLEANKYNYIRFASKNEINEYMPLEFSFDPDTVIRVLMEFKGLDEYIEVPEQKLETPSRDGFVVVEWGGTELK